MRGNRSRLLGATRYARGKFPPAANFDGILRPGTRPERPRREGALTESGVITSAPVGTSCGGKS